MSFLALDKMWERIEIARQDSDTALFYDLLFAGEMIFKIITAGLVAAISEDRERHRYRHLHHLVFLIFQALILIYFCLSH
jgi:hypothetical protein